MKTFLMLMLLGFGSVSFALTSSSLLDDDSSLSIDNVINAEESKEGITFKKHDGSDCGERFAGKDSEKKGKKLQLAIGTEATNNG